MADNNTARSFSDKWHRNKDLAFSNTLNPESDVFKWILGRNGFNSPEQFRSFLSGKTRILDAGCGNGRVTALLRTNSNEKQTEVIGIDLTAHDVAAENLSGYSNVKFYEKNLLHNLEDLGRFDFIYCQEVLHHTGNAEKGFDNLVEILEQGGEIAIYVYKKKAPLREFADDFIRDRIKSMPYEDAMKHCRQITELGRVLSNSELKITVPDVEILEIKAGEYDVQRFVYHFFAKCFWNQEFSFEENAVINYDWYHPQDCTRHTMDEVLGWFAKNRLKVVHSFEDFYGITVRGVKE